VWQNFCLFYCKKLSIPLWISIRCGSNLTHSFATMCLYNKPNFKKVKLHICIYNGYECLKENSKPPKPEKRNWELIIPAYNSQIHETILVCEVLKVESIYSTKMIPVQLGSTELHMHENCVLVLPVNILTVWHTGLATQHTTMCLDVMDHCFKKEHVIFVTLYLKIAHTLLKVMQHSY